MMLNVTCPGCGAHFSAGEEHAGKRAKCAKCGAIVTIPTLQAPGARPLAPRSESAPRVAAPFLPAESTPSAAPQPTGLDALAQDAVRPPGERHSRRSKQKSAAKSTILPIAIGVGAALAAGIGLGGYKLLTKSNQVAKAPMRSGAPMESKDTRKSAAPAPSKGAPTGSALPDLPVVAPAAPTEEAQVESAPSIGIAESPAPVAHGRPSSAATPQSPTATPTAGRRRVAEVLERVEENAAVVKDSAVEVAVVDAKQLEREKIGYAWMPIAQLKSTKLPTEISVEGTKPAEGFTIAGAEKESGSPLPKYLLGAQVVRCPVDPAHPDQRDGQIELKINKDCYLVLATFFDPRQKLDISVFEKQDWKSAGNSKFLFPGDAAPEARALVFRGCRRGEVLQIRTHSLRSPWVILPEQRPNLDLEITEPGAEVTPSAAADMIRTKSYLLNLTGRYDELER
jgi:hypothetical protein